MTVNRTNDLIRYLHGIARPESDPGATNGQLLGRFVESRDPAAFAELVRVLGPLVWGVCRRVLVNEQDAEDAFQTTFLVLANKAPAVQPRDGVADWLHGVARRAALQARRAGTRRRVHEVQVTDRPDPPASAREIEPDLRAILDEELSRLPDDERAVLILCDLVGHTRGQAARELGWPEGTVAGRLARARERLRARLTRRGYAVSATGLCATGAGPGVSASVPAALHGSTIESATVAAGTSSHAVAALTREVLRVMERSKQLKIVTVLVLGLAVTCSGFGTFLHRSIGQEKAAPPTTEATGPGTPGDPASDPTKKKETVAWGKAEDGLQAGLEFRLDGVPADESARLVVKLRNVGKDTIRVKAPPLWLSSARLYSAKGNTRVRGLSPPDWLLGAALVSSPIDLKPGQTVELGYAVLRETDRKPVGADQPRPAVQEFALTYILAPGKYRVSFGDLLDDRPSLTTGTLAFEFPIKDAKPASVVPPKDEKGTDPTKALTVTIKDVTLTDVDEVGGTISVSFGDKDKPTKLVNVPLADGVRVVASHVRPGVVNNLPFRWEYATRLKGKVVSIRVATSATGISVVSIASGND